MALQYLVGEEFVSRRVHSVSRNRLVPETTLLVQPRCGGLSTIAREGNGMAAASLSITKRMGESFKAGCRLLCRPILPVLPDSVLNRLPFLGRVCVRGPNGLRLRFHTYGPFGKDRIAIKLARRGFWGYEGETVRVFLMLVEQAHAVFDVGANTGLFALLAGKANPHCRIWAFEPVPFIFDMLRGNVRLNQLSNVETVPCAASDVSGETTFYLTRTSVGVPTDSSSCVGFRADVEPIRVPTITVDDYVRQHGVTRLDLVKIDAEAAESKVLKGAAQTIARHRPYIICEVLDNVEHGLAQQMMEALAYVFFHIAPAGLEKRATLSGSLAVDQRNYLLAPREKEAELMGICAKARLPIR
jgi:FkbM family methyltransferase